MISATPGSTRRGAGPGTPTAARRPATAVPQAGLLPAPLHRRPRTRPAAPDGPGRRPGPPPPDPRGAPQRYRTDGPPAVSGRRPAAPVRPGGAAAHARRPGRHRRRERPRGQSPSRSARAAAPRAAAQPRPRRKPVSPWRWVRRVAYVGLGAMLLGPFVAFVVGWILFPVPSSQDAALTQVATFTFVDGEELATVRPENVNRVDDHARQGAGARAPGRAVGRGPLLLLQPRVRLRRHRPRRLQPAHRRRRRWLHDHPAVREGVHRPGRLLPVAQVQGGHPRGQDLPREDEGRDPRELPQHDLLRPRCLRHRGGGEGVLQQERGPADGVGGRDARRHHPVPVTVGPGEEPRALAGAVELRARRHGRAGMARPGRAGGADVPRAAGDPGAGRRRSRRRPLPHLRPRHRRACGEGHHRGRHRHPGRHRHHHGQAAVAGRGRGHHEQADQGPARQPALRAGLDRPEDRGDHRLLRRARGAGPRLRRRGLPPAGVVVQALRAGRRAAGQLRLRPRHPVRRHRTEGVPGSRREGA